jgi:hypothetical protein
MRRRTALEGLLWVNGVPLPAAICSVQASLAIATSPATRMLRCSTSALEPIAISW